MTNSFPTHIKKIYMLGICGTGMGSLAGLLKQKGYDVCGADNNVYPPMSTQLEKQNIKVFSPYSADRLRETKPDLVIVGNVIPKTNVEAIALLESKIPYVSMPQALHHFFLKDKDVIVVAGTHGKTTTTAIAAHVLTEMGEDPSFMIGGIAKNFDTNFRIGNGKYFVIEGDEYDTAFFDKGPKFLHYNPKHVILTSIEFDHADIYRDLDHLTGSFVRLLNLIPADGSLHYFADDPQIHHALKLSQLNPECFKRGYGISSHDWTIQNFQQGTTQSHFDLVQTSPSPLPLSPRGRGWPSGRERGNQDEQAIQSPIPGIYNALNIASVLSVIEHLGLDVDKATAALKTFQGVKRRQDILFQNDKYVVIDDFAHHPTAVKETIQALKDSFPTHHLVAIFEPRSNTSRRNVFQKEYAECFLKADEIFLAPVNHPEKIEDGQVLDIAQIVNDLTSCGKKAHGPVTIEEIIAHFSNSPFPLLSRGGKKVVFLIMSNGDFGGLQQKIVSTICASA